MSESVPAAEVPAILPNYPDPASVITNTLIYEAGADTSAPMLTPSVTREHKDGRKALVYYANANAPASAQMADTLEPVAGDPYVLVAGLPSPISDWPLTAEERKRLEAGVKVYFADKVAPSYDADEVEFDGDIAVAILDTKIRISTAKKHEGKPVKGSPHQSFFDQSGEITFQDFLLTNLSKIRRGAKNGTCFVPASLKDGRRTANATTAIYMLVLDVDSGPNMEETIAKAKALGLFFVAYTTHSHGTTHVEYKKDRYIKWAGDNGHETDLESVSRDEASRLIRLFMADEGKYVADVIGSAEFVNITHESTAIMINLRTRPIDKFRLVFVLDKPFIIAKFPGRQKDALTAWGDMILGMGAALGIKVDRACRDASRLYYLPSGEPGATNSRVHVHAGREGSSELATATGALDWTKIKPVSIREHNATTDDPFDRAGSRMAGNGMRSPESPTKGINLWQWEEEHGHGFLIADVFKDHCVERLRPAEETGPGKYTCECPFDENHSNAGDPEDPGCFIQNAGVDAETYRFRCSHDSCADRRPADMLQKAMVEGWFPDEVLTDDRYDVAGTHEVDADAGADSDPDERETKLLGLNALIKKAGAEKQRDGFLSASTMEALVECVAKQKSRVAIYERIKKTVKIAITDFKKEVEIRAKELAQMAKNKARKKDAKAGEVATIYSGDDFPDQTATLLRGLRRLNDPPYMFLHGGDMKRLPGEAEQHTVGGFLKRMSFTDFKSECNDAVTYVAESKEGDRVASLAEDIPAQVWGMRDKPLPVADRFTRVPVFGPDGTLRTEDGYDAATRTILQTSGLNLDPVPSVPSATDLATAKGWLLGNALADFPFVDDFGGSESSGDGSSSKAHAIVMLIQQSARGLFTGPTPFFFIDKPQPGTGSGLLVEVLYQIVVGRPASPQALGKNEDEIRKGITTKLSSGAPIIFYDNVRNKIHGEALAILGTADWWEDRLLGGNETYVGPNRALTVFTGNNMTMSDEMVRRMLPIRLDAKMSDPGSRANFVVPDLRNWIVEYRAKLVWSCLVLVQNWIATGRERSKVHLASYEDFAAVMGGILEAAGISGFLGNLDAFRGSAKIEATEESGYMQALVDAQPIETAFSTDDAHGILYDPYGRLLFPSLNINEDDAAAQKRILGMRLRNHVGRQFKLTVKGIETEVRFERAAVVHNTSRWRFVLPSSA